jgi:PAS domain S-box-containing protein
MPSNYNLDPAVFSTAFENAADMILISDVREPGEGWARIMFANAECLREMGYRASELIGSPTTILFADPTAEEVVALGQAVRDKVPATALFVSKRKDGSTFKMETRSRPLFDASNAYVGRVILARNISRQRLTLELTQLFEAAFEQASDGIALLDPDPKVGGDPQVVYVNAAFLKQTGYDPHEVAQRKASMLFGPETNLREIERMRATIATHQSATAELVLYRKGGTPYWAEVTSYPLRGENGEVVRWLVFSREITARRQIEQELRILRTALESADDSIVVYRIEAEPKRPVIMFMNDAIVRHSGFSREELMNDSTGVGPETDRAQVAEMRRKLLEGEPVRMRLRLYHKDLSPYWGEITARPIKDEHGVVTHLVTIERDVSDAIGREQKLEHDNRVLAALMDVSRRLFGALTADALREQLLEGVERLTGVKPVEHAGVLAAADPFLQRAGQSRVPIVDRTHDRAAFAIPSSDNAPAVIVEVDAAAAGVRLERSVILALQLLAQNYRTAQQNAALYEELGEQRAAVVELNQTKSDLIAMLAHDFRGPLTSIMGFADLLRNEEIERDEQLEMLDLILEASRSLTRLATDTLAMARMEENELTLDLAPIDLTELTESVAATFRDKREVRVIAPAQPLVVAADADRMRQTLENLIGNALKYSPRGGSVTVEILSVDESAEIRVMDTGIGIPPEDIDRIFTRFARAGNALSSGIGGTGFGLYISRAIVERHGGRLSVKSELGQGSTFVARLPLAPGLSATPSRVLLGDPAGSVRSLTAHALRAGGRAVKACGTWKELSSELSAGTYDMAVLDVESFGSLTDPVQTFIDECNVARVPVVLIGADRIERFEGHAASLSKPYMMVDLLDTIGRLDERGVSVGVTRRRKAAPRRTRSTEVPTPPKKFV